MLLGASDTTFVDMSIIFNRVLAFFGFLDRGKQAPGKWLKLLIHDLQLSFDNLPRGYHVGL